MATHRYPGLAEMAILNVVAILLASGAHPYALTKKTVSPIETAAEGGHLDIVEALLSAYHQIPVAEKRRAMSKASTKGRFNIIAFLVENGVDLQGPQSLTSAAGIAHFNILDHWMKSIIGDLGVRPLDARKVEIVAAAYPTGPPTWGFDGSLVARYSWPLRIFFRSDLTSSTMRCFWSSILLRLGLAFRMARTFAILLSALVGLLLGLGLLGVEFVVLNSSRRGVDRV